MDHLRAASQTRCGDDPLHTVSRPTTLWTTVNAAEALPGLVTPLTWSWYRIVAELSTRGAFHDLGVLASAEVCFPTAPDDRIIGVFFGRNAINVTLMRSLVERIPGQSGDDFERQLFDTPVSNSPSPRTSRRRYPVILARAPRAAALVRRRLRALGDETDRWWRASVNEDGLLPGRDAAAVFAESKVLAIRIYVVHVVGSMLATGVVGKLSALARESGVPGIESRILTGLGSIGETTMLDDLWTVSRSQSELAAFRRRFGYHGPKEGELSAHSWREDPRPLLSLLETYREMPEEAAPRAVLARQRAEARAAKDELLAATGGRRRLEALALLGLARHYVPMRELGRSTLLRAVDGARAAARAGGAERCREGRLADPVDAFFLTSDELFGVPAGGPTVVAERRKRYTTYAGFDLPEWWKGVPDPLTEASLAPAEVAGIPVSPGVIEGRARVLLSPEDCEELQAGEIVVCPFTDPGWAALFLVAGALVIDVGGPMSHGAIVARELGVPCVINTRTGTRVFSTGDLVRVDGTTGSVVRLERAASRPTHPVPNVGSEA